MMLLVAASEKGIGQTESVFEKKLEMWWRYEAKLLRESFLESDTLEGDSPVDEDDMVILNRVGLPGLEV